MARFTGKRVLITGGTSGIGWAGAKRIAVEEGQLILTGTHQHRLTEAHQALLQAQVLDNDTADPNAAESLAGTVADSGGWTGCGSTPVTRPSPMSTTSAPGSSTG